MTFFLNGFEVKIPNCKDMCLQTEFTANKLIQRRLYSKTFNKNTIELMFAEPVQVVQNVQGKLNSYLLYKL